MTEQERQEYIRRFEAVERQQAKADKKLIEEYYRSRSDLPHDIYREPDTHDEWRRLHWSGRPTRTLHVERIFTTEPEDNDG